MDKDLKTQAANGEIAAYTALLGIRKKSALRGIVATGILAVASLAAALVYIWAFRDRAITSTTMLPMAVFVVYPPIHLAIQAAEHRRLNGLLELLDVLQRATGEGALERRETKVA